MIHSSPSLLPGDMDHTPSSGDNGDNNTSTLGGRIDNNNNKNNNNCGVDPLDHLNEDVLQYTFSFLDPLDLTSLAQVSRSWRTYIMSNESWWRSLIRREGVDVREWRRAKAEREALARKESHAQVPDALWGADHTTVEELVQAYRGHRQLQDAWSNRHVYETQMAVPEFKLRDIMIDHSEDYIYALSDHRPAGNRWIMVPDSGVEKTPQNLHVLDRYSGKLLLSIPWITADAIMAVGAGYVVVSSSCGNRDHRRSYDHRDHPSASVGYLTIYRTANAAERRAGVATALDMPQISPFKSQRGLPLEHATTLRGYEAWHAFCVGLDTRGDIPHAVLAGVDYSGVSLCSLDSMVDGTPLIIEHYPINLRELDQPDPAGSLPDAQPETSLRSVTFDEDYVYVGTSRQLVVISRKTKKKVVAFPDPTEPILPANKTAHVVYQVYYNYPYGSRDFNRDDPQRDTDVPTGPSDTITFTILGHSGQYREEAGSGTHLMFGATTNPQFTSIKFTTGDLVVGGDGGVCLVVRDFRRVLRDVERMEHSPTLRREAVAANTIMFTFTHELNVAETIGDRIVFHSDRSILTMIDTNDFPDLSSVKTESDEVPPLPASGFEISSIEDLQYRSWVAVDARGVYLSDWDKGFPTNTANYEHAHEEQMGGHWDYEVEPNWGCIKVWSHRPEAEIMHRDHCRRVREHLTTPQHYWQPIDTFHQPPEPETILDTGALAFLFGYEYVSEQEEGSGDSYEEDSDGSHEEEEEDPADGEQVAAEDPALDYAMAELIV